MSSSRSSCLSPPSCPDRTPSATMNTPQTMLLGWGSLIVAAGVSFYYAKQTIIERRALQEARGQRPSEKLDWRSRIERQEQAAAGTGPGGGAGTQNASSASSSGVDSRVPGKGIS
ncbi:hypothetical protein C8Q74DRAFT_1295529 [Fomes fomentarius]|nr:hypothetical protein C8Q74DRAFT_1295529 [Fomes fomentarius]